MLSKKINPIIILFTIELAKNCNLSQFIFINMVCPYANLRITGSHKYKAILYAAIL